MTTVTGTTDIDPCPYCGTTSGVQPTSDTPPGVTAWSCTACQTDWAISSVSSRPYFEQLAATVEQLGVLWQVITLADDAPGLTDQQLRDRLLALADRAVSVSGSR